MATADPAEQPATPTEGYSAHSDGDRVPMADLRATTCAMLDGLDEAAKGRASVVRSSAEIKDLPEGERQALKELLRSITEQRKRLRTLRRLWQSLDGFERPSTDLVDATELELRESREMARALDPWRTRSTAQLSQTLATTWDRLAVSAALFTRPTGSGLAPASAPPRSTRHPAT